MTEFRVNQNSWKYNDMAVKVKKKKGQNCWFQCSIDLSEDVTGDI